MVSSQRAIVDHQHGDAGHAAIDRAHHAADGAHFVERRHDHQQRIGTVRADHSAATFRALMEWAAHQMPEDGRRDARAAADFAPLAPQSRQVRQQGGVRAQHVPDHFGPACPSARKRAALPAPFEQVPGMPRIARQRDKRRRQQHAGGKILHQHEQAIALHVIGFQGRCAAGGMRVMVLHHGVGNVEALPSGPAGAQPQVGIFAIEEEAAVEGADGLQHGAPVERRRSAGKKRFLGDREILRRTAVAALFAGSVARHQHAGGIQAMLAEEAHLRGAHAGVGTPLDGVEQGVDPLRMAARPSALDRSAARAIERRPDAGMCASQVRLFGEHRLDSAGMLVARDGSSKQRGNGRPPEDFPVAEETLFPSGSAALYRRAMLDAIGAFDSRFFLYCEDTDLGLRARWAGWKCLYVPEAVVEHHYSHSAGARIAAESVLRGAQPPVRAGEEFSRAHAAGGAVRLPGALSVACLVPARRARQRRPLPRRRTRRAENDLVRAARPRWPCWRTRRACGASGAKSAAARASPRRCSATCCAAHAISARKVAAL